MDRVIYPHGDGIAVLIPTGALPIEEVARKDVPAGVPYLFASLADIPTDRSGRDRWEADFSTPDGYGIGAEAWFAEQAAAQAAAEAEAEGDPEPGAGAGQ
ncbi:hypothetical protein R2G56_08585 [Nitratireductor aquimarinus]|uniref:Uncharacterized protein n=1 Tax=Nitratireductor aquimarinus TaxID=889300 RepID=A0ABU4AJD2_9HYPH|nr:hypothetical protein [Nitratireductor aquimarinus]MDV6226339.1 hypothetical protein [Nitratireductor aquimarinus]